MRLVVGTMGKFIALPRPLAGFIESAWRAGKREGIQRNKREREERTKQRKWESW